MSATPLARGITIGPLTNYGVLGVRGVKAMNCHPGSRLTKYLTIYHEIIVSLS